MRSMLRTIRARQRGQFAPLRQEIRGCRAESRLLVARTLEPDLLMAGLSKAQVLEGIVEAHFR